MMGAGKSTIGKKLAELTELGFVDADHEIEQAAGMSIEDIFDRFGEAEFRSGEKRVISRLLKEGPSVIATGGGAFMDEETRNVIGGSGVSIWLDANIEILMQRVMRRSNRPLIKTEDPQVTMENLLAERNPVYALADFRVESRNASRDVVAAEVLDMLCDGLTAANAAQ